jgi:biopolymer transport protein ExbB
MSILLQMTLGGDSTNVLTAPPAPPESINLMDLAFKGGWIMIPLALMSLIAVYIFFERIMAISKAGKEDSNFMNNIKDFITHGKIDSAVSLCRVTGTPISRMIEKGVSRIGRPLDDISVAITNVAKLEIYKMERSLALMATIAGAAPMLGFLGTVMGMVKAFFNMASAGESIVISALAGGIYEAMVTTVAGLIVGILAYVGYNILVANVEKVIFKMEARSIEFMDLLNEPT